MLFELVDIIGYTIINPRLQEPTKAQYTTVKRSPKFDVKKVRIVDFYSHVPRFNPFLRKHEIFVLLHKAHKVLWVNSLFGHIVVTIIFYSISGCMVTVFALYF